MKFIITCAARSGSTMLRHMLNSHPNILCHGEVLRLRTLTRFFTKVVIGNMDGNSGEIYRSDKSARRRINRIFQKHPADFLDEYIFTGDNTHHKVCGFKFKTDELFNPRFDPFSKYILDSKTIAIIHLRRKNLLEQYISHMLVKNKTVPTAIFEGDDHVIATKRYTIDPEEVVGYFREIIQRETRVGEEFKDHRMCDVWYEDLIDSDRAIHDILEFLNVPQQSLKKETKKLLYHHYSYISNLDDVLESLYSARLEGRISQPK